MRDIAVVIGGSRGIGAAIVKKLNSQFKVFYFFNKSLSSDGGYRCDITDYEKVKETMADMVERFGTPKLLINCAGFVEPKSLRETTPEEWDHTIKVNLSGVFYCTKEFVKYIYSTPDYGKIINIASTAGTRSSPGWSAYAAAKAGLINFSLTMAEELRPYGIKVYCVAPGRCATELRRKLAPDEDQSKIMQPEEVADFVYYLATQDDGILDGQVLTVRRNEGFDD